MARHDGEESLQQTLDRLAAQDEDLAHPVERPLLARAPITPADPSLRDLALADAARTRRTRWLRRGVVVVALAVLLGLVAAVGSTVDRPSTTPPSPGDWPAPSSPSASGTPTPSATGPSDVAALPATPLPAVGLVEARRVLDGLPGAFAPLARRGTGSARVGLHVGWTGLVVVHLSRPGTVTLYNAGGEPSVDHSPGEVPAGDLTTPFGLDFQPEAVGVSSPGAWTLRVLPFSAAPVLSGTTKGRGTAVLLSLGGTRGWSIAASSEVFVSSYLSTTDLELETWDWQRTATWPARTSPEVVVIEADPTTTWTVIPR